MSVVTVYSKPDCQGCRMTKKLLDAQGVEYVELDVTVDAKARRHVESLGITMLPVVEAGEARWNGFRPDHLRGLAVAV